MVLTDIEPEIGGIIPIDQLGNGMAGMAGQKAEPNLGRSVSLPGETTHRQMQQAMGRVPVFAAAAMGDDQIGIG